MWDKIFQRKLKKIEKRGEQQKAKQELIYKYAEYYPSKQRKVSNVMLAIIVVMIIGYVAASFILQYVTGSEISPTITTCWFSFWGAEIVALAGIKVSKVLRTLNDDDNNVG